MAKSGRAIVTLGHNRQAPTLEYQSWSSNRKVLPSVNRQVQVTSSPNPLPNLPTDIGEAALNCSYDNSFPELVEVHSRVTRLEERAAKRDDEITQLNNRFSVLENLMQPFVVTKVCITAQEILERAVGALHEKYGEGRQYFYRTPEVKRQILLACQAYGLYGLHPDGESIEAFKVVAQSVIADRNDATHIDTVEKLGEMVKDCVHSFGVFPNLLTEYPNQCQVIIRFGDFIKYLPEEFCIKKD